MTKQEKYNQYIIHSQEWQYVREKAFKLKGKVCQKCKSTHNLNVHHATYKRLYKENIETDLFILCNNCHFEYHNTINGGTTIKKTKNFIFDIKTEVIKTKKTKHKERCNDNSSLFKIITSCRKCGGKVSKRKTNFHKDNTRNKISSHYFKCSPCKAVYFPKKI